jgi:prepilin-type N-terminal cleavage/methylation domain-containing protein
MIDAVARRRERGFTLLEIMVALAILAVGSICVLATFAAALALQVRRDADARAARVFEEARIAAQAAYDSWTPATPGDDARSRAAAGSGAGRRPSSAALKVPPPIEERAYSRDPSVAWSATFSTAEGIPGDAGVFADLVVVEQHEVSSRRRERKERVFLAAGGIPAAELRTSRTYDEERRDEEERRLNPPRPNERPR